MNQATCNWHAPQQTCSAFENVISACGHHALQEYCCGHLRNSIPSAEWSTTCADTDSLFASRSRGDCSEGPGGQCDWRIVGLWHFVYCATAGESSRMVLGSSLPFQSTELSTTMMPIDKHLIVSVLKQPSPTSCKRQKNRLSFTTPPLKKSWPLPWKSTEIPECCADFMAILSSNPACRRSSKKISPNS